MGAKYSLVIAGVAATAQVDLFEINVASTRSLRLLSIELGQSTDAGDAQDEQLGISIITGYTTSGSGGSAAPANPLSLGGGAAASSANEVMNTTLATGGTPVTRIALAFNVRAGFIYKPTPEEMMEFIPSTRAVVRLGGAPADSLTFWGTAIFEEFGG